jgi:hypothetical protein
MIYSKRHPSRLNIIDVGNDIPGVTYRITVLPRRTFYAAPPPAIGSLEWREEHQGFFIWTGTEWLQFSGPST